MRGGRWKCRAMEAEEKSASEELEKALDKALASNCPAVVEVISDVDAMSKRAWRPSPAAAH